MPLRTRLRWFRDDPRGLMVLSIAGLVVLGLALWLAARFDVEVASAGVAGVGGALVVLFVVSLRARKVYSFGREAAGEVRALREAVAHDARRMPARRQTGATHDSLLDVVDLLERAEGDLTHAGEAAAAERLSALPSLTEDWAPGPLREQAASLVAHARAIESLEDQNAETLRQRPTLRGRVEARRRPDDVATRPPATPAPAPREAEPASPTPTGDLPPAEAYPEVMTLVDAGEILEAMKSYRARTRVGLADAKTAVEAAAARR